MFFLFQSNTMVSGNTECFGRGGLMKKLLLVLPRHEKGYWGHLSKSGKAGMARLSLTVIASLTPPEWRFMT